jgi:hypothetical protein
MKMPTNAKKSTKYSAHPSAQGEFWSGTSLEEWETVELTVDRYAYEDLRDTDGRTEEKIVVYFHEDTRGLTLNKTRGAALVKTFGDDMDGWIGERVELYIVDTQMGPGIRIRAAKAEKKEAKAKSSERDRDDRDDRRAPKKPAARERRPARPSKDDFDDERPID